MGRRTRLHVNVSTPDGGASAGRGLGGWLSDAAPARARGEVTVAIVSDRRMRVLNRTFRGQDCTTDVLSFPAAGSIQAPRGGSRGASTAWDAEVSGLTVPALGDIVIAAGVAARQARDHGHSRATEYRVLALHGLLHLLGYDHDDPSDQGRMARAEARLRRKAGLPSGLIARTVSRRS